MRPAATVVDLAALGRDATTGGPQWGHETEDLDCTMLCWLPGQGVPLHVNEEVDVVMVVLDGEGEVAVGDETHLLRAGQAIVIPMGLSRSVRATGERFCHLNVHRRRKRLMPAVGGRPPSAQPPR